MKKLLLSALALTMTASTALADTHYIADPSGIVFEQGAADGEKIDTAKETGVIGFIDVEAFKFTVPAKKLGKFRNDIESAIKKTSERDFNNHDLKLNTDQQHLADATMGNGLRSGFFSGLLNDKGYKGNNIFKGDSAFTRLPASFNEENKSSAKLDDGVADKISGFAFNVKSITSSPKDTTKTVSYDFVTKSNLYGDKWQTDSYKFDLTPGQQKFVYTMPNVDASYKGKVDVYVYAVYPFLMQKFYK